MAKRKSGDSEETGDETPGMLSDMAGAQASYEEGLSELIRDSGEEIIAEPVDESTALMKWESYQGFQRVPVEAMRSLMDDLDRFIQTVLVKGTDYDLIPGTGDKPVLLKPGAEKLCFFFRLVPTFPVELRVRVQDWTGAEHGGEPFFYYEYTCRLLRDGAVVAEGVGSVNSWEKKYRYRESQRTCPKCQKPCIIKGREEYGGGWLCFAKKGGCGAKFRNGDSDIEGQSTGQVPNPEVFDQVNTMDKMAQKRAFVAPVLLATGTSGRFTQDVDEFGHERLTAAPVQVWSPEATDGSNAVGNDTILALRAVMTRIPADERTGVLKQRLRVLFDNEELKVSNLRQEAADMLLRDLSTVAGQFERAAAATATADSAE